MICCVITTSAACRDNVMKCFPLWHLQRRESAVWSLSPRIPGSLVSLSISFVLSADCLKFSSWCVGTSFWFAPQRGHVFWATSITIFPHLPLSTAQCSCDPPPTSGETGRFPLYKCWLPSCLPCVHLHLLQVAMQDFPLLTEHLPDVVRKSKFGVAQNRISVQCFVHDWVTSHRSLNLSEPQSASKQVWQPFCTSVGVIQRFNFCKAPGVFLGHFLCWLFRSM